MKFQEIHEGKAEVIPYDETVSVKIARDLLAKADGDEAAAGKMAEGFTNLLKKKIAEEAKFFKAKMVKKK